MKPDYKKILVIDLECTCWERGKEPKDQIQDIIEIGLAVLKRDEPDNIEIKSILVKPQRSQISDYCTALTTLEEEDIKNKWIILHDACNVLKKYGSQNALWGSWGFFDKKALFGQCDDFKIPYPFRDMGYINIKMLFSLFYKQDKGLGMMKALNISELSLNGTHHRGVDDAYNTARILQKLLGWDKGGTHGIKGVA